MPYRHAHFYVGFVLLVILTGFWASYFTRSGPMPLAFHVHAITAMSWLALLIVQSVAIHRRMNALHRSLGLLSFAFFPFLMLGLAMIINVTADRYAARESEFILFFGPASGIGMGIAIAAYLTLFYLALKHRRNVRLHAGYMLATPLILFESPFSRVIGDLMPWLNVIGSEGPREVIDTIVIGNAFAIVFALALWARNRKHGAPWLVAIGFMIAQSVAMWFAPDIAVVRSLFAAYAQVPSKFGLIMAIVAGGAAGWLGWRAGLASFKRPPAQAALSPG